MIKIVIALILICMTIFALQIDSKETFIVFDDLDILNKNKCTTYNFNANKCPEKIEYHIYPYTSVDTKYSDAIKIIDKLTNEWLKNKNIERIYCFGTIRTDNEQMIKVLVDYTMNRKSKHLLLLFHCKISDDPYIFRDNNVKYLVNLVDYIDVTNSIHIIKSKINDNLRSMKNKSHLFY